MLLPKPTLIAGLCLLLSGSAASLAAEPPELMRLRHFVSDGDTAGAASEIDRLSPAFSGHPEFRQLQADHLRSIGRSAERSGARNQAANLFRQADELEAAPIREAFVAKNWAFALERIRMIESHEGLTPRCQLLYAEYWIFRREDALDRRAPMEAISAFRSAKHYWKDNPEIERELAMLQSGGTELPPISNSRSSARPAMDFAPQSSPQSYSKMGGAPMSPQGPARRRAKAAAPPQPAGGDWPPYVFVLTGMLLVIILQLSAVLLVRRG